MVVQGEIDGLLHDPCLAPPATSSASAARPRLGWALERLPWPVMHGPLETSTAGSPMAPQGTTLLSHSPYLLELSMRLRASSSPPSTESTTGSFTWTSSTTAFRFATMLSMWARFSERRAPTLAL